MTQIIPKPLDNEPINKNFGYMLFILGIVLILVGVYLSTYTTVVMVNKPTNIMGQIFNVPTAEQIQPYQSIGVILILSAVIMVVIGLLQTQKK